MLFWEIWRYGCPSAAAPLGYLFSYFLYNSCTRQDHFSTSLRGVANKGNALLQTASLSLVRHVNVPDFCNPQNQVSRTYMYSQKPYPHLPLWLPFKLWLDNVLCYIACLQKVVRWYVRPRWHPSGHSINFTCHARPDIARCLCCVQILSNKSPLELELPIM